MTCHRQFKIDKSNFTEFFFSALSNRFKPRRMRTKPLPCLKWTSLRVFFTNNNEGGTRDPWISHISRRKLKPTLFTGETPPPARLKMTRPSLRSTLKSAGRHRVHGLSCRRPDSPLYSPKTHLQDTCRVSMRASVDDFRVNLETPATRSRP